MSNPFEWISTASNAICAYAAAFTAYIQWKDRKRMLPPVSVTTSAASGPAKPRRKKATKKAAAKKPVMKKKPRN